MPAPDRRHVTLRLVAAALGGLLLLAAFPPLSMSMLVIPGTALLICSMYRAVWWLGAAAGLTSGLVFFVPLLRWMTVVGNDAWIGLSLFCALWFCLTGVAIAFITRVRWWVLLVPCAWLLQEALRDRIPWGGFPWGNLAFSQGDSAFTPYAWLGGAPLVSWCAVLSGSLVAYALVKAGVTDRGSRTLGDWLAPYWPVLVALAVPAITLLTPSTMGGLWKVGPIVGQDAAGPAYARVAIIQGNVPATGMSAFDVRRAVLDNHVSETIALAQDVASGKADQPDIVIWPENASDLDLFREVDAAQAISVAARAINAPILVGAVLTTDKQPPTRLNVGLVWNPDTGPGEMYVKTHPVPFGEYIPFRQKLTEWIGRFDRIPYDFEAGDKSGVLQVGPVRIADVICFEIAYDEIVQTAVAGGGRMLVVQTNNATWAGYDEPVQQLAMAQLRAVETGRTVAVAATSGVTALFIPGADPVSLPQLQAGYIDALVPLRDSMTPATMAGQWPELVLATVGLLSLLFSLTLAIRAGQRVRRRTPTHTA